MKFNEFLESTYIQTNQQIRSKYTSYGHAKTLATKELIDTQRNLFKLISKFQIVLYFFAMKLRLVKKLDSPQEIFDRAPIPKEQSEAVNE